MGIAPFMSEAVALQTEKKDAALMRRQQKTKKDSLAEYGIPAPMKNAGAK